jgi:propionyl-CoA carboxylase beta chain
MAPVYPYSSPATNQQELRPALDHLVPASPNLPYDMLGLIDEILDPDTRFELQPDYAANMITAFGLLGGRSIGVVANQPSSLAGVLDINASRKAARFVRFCDSFNVPLLVLVDVPGFLPGTDQEWNGIIAHGAKLLYAFSEATVPRITVITRKAYGGAYDVMNSKHIGADYNFAWPGAEIAVMGAKGAAEIIFKHEIQSAGDPVAKWDEKVALYTEHFANPYQAASRGYVDEIIVPSQTRRKLISAFGRIANKAVRQPRKKHGNIPL